MHAARAVNVPKSEPENMGLELPNRLRFLGMLNAALDLFALLVIEQLLYRLLVILTCVCFFSACAGSLSMCGSLRSQPHLLSKKKHNQTWALGLNPLNWTGTIS